MMKIQLGSDFFSRIMKESKIQWSINESVTNAFARLRLRFCKSSSKIVDIDIIHPSSILSLQIPTPQTPTNASGNISGTSNWNVMLKTQTRAKTPIKMYGREVFGKPKEKITKRTDLVTD